MPQQVPGRSLPKSKRETDEQAVARLLFQHAPSLSERYEKWGEEHPIQQTALELGTDYALSAVGPRVLRRLPGAFKTAGQVWEQVQRGWDPFHGPYIEDPELKWGEMKPLGTRGAWKNMYSTPVYDMEGNDKGYVNFRVNKTRKQIHIDYASAYPSAEGKYGTGQMMHLNRQLAERFPDMETVRFTRISGAVDKNKKPYLEEVTMPLNRHTMDPSMFRRVVEQNRPNEEFTGPMPGKKESRIIRKPLVTRENVSFQGGRRLGSFDWQPETQPTAGEQRTSQRIYERLQQQGIIAEPGSLSPGAERRERIFRELDQQRFEPTAEQTTQDLEQMRLRERQMVADREDYEEYQRRVQQQNISPQKSRMILNYADERDIPATQSLDTYNEIQNRIGIQGEIDELIASQARRRR